MNELHDQVLDSERLKSFKRAAFASTPSLRASVKSKRSPLKMSILPRRRRAQSTDLSHSGIKDKDCNATPPSPPKQAPASPRISSEGRENEESRIGTSVPRIKPTRSMTILRMFSSKLRPSSPPKPSQPIARSPSQINSAFGSREARDAALRERGLLPPLKPNVDLSSAERERDQRLPVLTPPSEDEISAEGIKVSAALRVKQEWEAQNKVVDTDLERQRLSSFTFGGPATPIAEEEGSSSLVLVSTPVDQQHPSQSEGPEEHSIAVMSPTMLTPRAKRLPPVLRITSTNLDDHNNSVELLHGSPTFDPYSIPLPPSPIPSILLSPSQDNLEETSLAASVPLPPSPRLSIRPLSQVFTPTSPTLSPLQPLSATSPTLVSEPFLHGTTVPGSDISDKPYLLSSPKDQDAIIESPVEEIPCHHTSVGPHDSNKVEHEDVSATGSTDLPKPSTRSLTDPEATVKSAELRKSSFKVFKRSTDPLPPRSPPPRRLSVGASLSNIRRSIVGTLSGKPTTGPNVRANKSGFDASRLPPSPRIPSTFVEARTSPIPSPKSPSPFFLQQQERPLSPEATIRIPVSPNFYSTGSIASAANKITDEESRRVTELAFLV
ncbi:hypothetical protein H0H93_010550 [Arthromyces matolae]|nr:hypothetical protein H0H93_010550 [Arthromyces matolae]